MPALLEKAPVQNEPAADTNHPFTHEDIELRAYFRYVDRGFVDGFAVDDWLAAETELLEKAQVTTVEP